MAVDAVELSFERDYITTFVLGTGDSDFTPLVHKLRELNKRVIGIGVEASTSALLPAACDEFLFYERLEGVEVEAARQARHQAGERPQHQDHAGRRGAPSRRGGAGGGDRPRRARDPHARRPLAQQRRSRAGVDAQARHPAQGADVQRGRSRVPHLRRAAAHARRARRGGGAPGHRARRPRGHAPDRRGRRGRRVRPAPRHGRATHGEGAGPPLGPEDPGAQATARLLREALRLRHLPAVRARRPGRAGSSRWSATPTPRTTWCAREQRRLRPDLAACDKLRRCASGCSSATSAASRRPSTSCSRTHERPRRSASPPAGCRTSRGASTA